MPPFFKQFFQDTIEFRKLPVLCLVAVVFWFTSLTVYSVSIDQEFAAFQAGPSWWVAQGRWATHLLTQYVMPQPVIPFLPHLLLCVSLAISYLFLLAAHGLRCSGSSIALFPIFAAFPTWYFIGEFYANLLSVSVGLLLCTFSVLLFTKAVRANDHRELSTAGLVLSVVGVSIMTGTALGTYQSYITAFAGMVLGVLLFEWRGVTESRPPHVWKRLFWIIVALVGAFLFYQLMSWWMKASLHVEGDYVGSFVNLSQLLAEPVSIVRSIVLEALRFYSGSRMLFGVAITGCGLLMVVGLVSLFAVRKSVGHQVGTALLALACLSAPFAMHLMSGGGATMPYRAMVAAPYVVWLGACLGMFAGTAVFRRLAYVLLVVAGFQLLYAHSNYAAARRLALDHDRALAGAIYERIVEQVSSFDRDASQKVDFHGAKSFQNPFPRPYSSTVGYSFFDWDRGNPVRIHFFMKLLGYDGLQLIRTSERDALQSHYAEMPKWPAEGSVRLVGDVVLVKLGEERGIHHDIHFRLIDEP